MPAELHPPPYDYDRNTRYIRALRSYLQNYREALIQKGLEIAKQYNDWAAERRTVEVEFVRLQLRARVKGKGTKTLEASWSRIFGKDHQGRFMAEHLKMPKTGGYWVHKLQQHCPESFHERVRSTERRLTTIRRAIWQLTLAERTLKAHNDLLDDDCSGLEL